MFTVCVVLTRFVLRLWTEALISCVTKGVVVTARGMTVVAALTEALISTWANGTTVIIRTTKGIECVVPMISFSVVPVVGVVSSLFWCEAVRNMFSGRLTSAFRTVEVVITHSARVAVRVTSLTSLGDTV